MSEEILILTGIYLWARLMLATTPDPVPELWDDTPIPDNDAVPVKYNVHTCFQGLPTETVQRFARVTAIPAALLLFNLTSNLNVGMCIRSTAAMGFSDVFVIGKMRYNRRSEVGAKNYVNIHRSADIGHSADQIRCWFRERALMPILVEQGGTPLQNMKFRSFMGPWQHGCRQKPVFIMGSESDGIPPEILVALRTSPRITIAQYGVLRSMNVATAASVVMYEYTRQWAAAVGVSL